MNILGQFYIDNGRFVDSWQKPVAQNGVTLYEVLRVIEGTPVFMEEHMQRLYKSVKLSAVAESPNLEQLKREAVRLVKANALKECNLRIELYYMATGKLQAYRIFEAYRPYPSAEMYSHGVKSMLVQEERKNPNAKVLRYNKKARAENIVTKNKLHDVIYVNNEGLITEGSRTNVFLVRDKVVYTAPERLVLKGITRQKVLHICRSLGMHLQFNPVKASDIDLYQAAFFTGTSPKVLPLKAIDDVVFNPENEIVRQLMEAYGALIREDIALTKNQYF